jgi:hypothetical protein
MFKFELGEIVGYDGLRRKDSFGFITDRRYTGKRTSYLVIWFHNSQEQTPFVWYEEQQLFKVSDV